MSLEASRTVIKQLLKESFDGAREVHCNRWVRWRGEKNAIRPTDEYLEKNKATMWPIMIFLNMSKVNLVKMVGRYLNGEFGEGR